MTINNAAKNRNQVYETSALELVTLLKLPRDEIVEAVKANDLLAEYVVFDDEGDGFRKVEDKIKGYKAVLDFLDLHLKKN